MHSRAAALCAILLTGTACASDAPRLTSNLGPDTGTVAVDTGVHSWAGNWVGTTSDGLPMTFAVPAGDTSIVNLSVSIRLTGDCGIDVFKANVAGTAGALIDNLWLLGDSSSVISLTGRFSTYRDMSGDVKSNYIGTFSDGKVCHSQGGATFTAKKQ